MSFGRTNRSLAKLTIAALFFAVLFSNEAQAMGDIDSFAELESCVANTSETECIITGDFEYTGNLAISRDLTIKGSATLSRAASYTGTLFSVAEGASLNLQNLTLDGGASGWEKDLKPEDILFRFNNTGTRVYGGYNVVPSDGDILADAPLIDNLGNINISSSTFQNNYNKASTASVISNRGELTIADSTFQHNIARLSSTVYNYDKAAISVSNSTFIDNNAGMGTTGVNGGAINSNYGSVVITGSHFENNSAVNDGGAVTSLSGELEISDSTFVRNSSGNDGSAIKLGRGLSATSRPLDEQSTGVLSNLTFSENINLSTYWNDGDLSPKGVAANGNGQGTFAYFNDGYDDLTIKDSTFSNDTTNWGIISLYSCDASDDPSLCIAPNYTIDNVSMQNETGSLMHVSSPGNVVIKNSTFEPTDGFLGVSIRDLFDVVIENTSIIGGGPSLFTSDNKTIRVKDVSIDGGDMAFYINKTPEIDIDGLTIKNSHHESLPDYYVSGIFGGDTATLSNINFFDNAGQMQLGDFKDLIVTDSYFCSSEEHALGISAPTGETNAIISNTAVCRDTTDGPAMIVQNYGDDESISRDINLTLGNGFKIVGNTNSGNPDDPDSLSGGYGGGLYVAAYDDINLTVSEGANISGNSASIAGNDIFMRNMNNTATIMATILGDYFEDNIGKRATDFNVPALEQYTLSGDETLGLAHAVLPDEGSDSDSGDASNPDTNDHLAINATIFAIASLCGIVIIHKRR